MFFTERAFSLPVGMAETRLWGALFEMNTTSNEFTIDPRFCGPPDMGNGGYVAGRLASFVGGAAKVTLRRPVPLGRPLKVERIDDATALLKHDETMIAEAGAMTLTLNHPELPSFESVAALDVPRGYARQHPTPGCFVCGVGRDEGDGLRIFPRLVPGTEIFAAPWVPGSDLADETGVVGPEFLWAALDCPGGVAAVGRELGREPKFMLLGRMTGRMVSQVRPGERCVVLAWVQGGERRKIEVGTAISSEDGALVGLGLSVWIQVDALAKA